MTEPIVAPVKKRKFTLADQEDLPSTVYSIEYVTKLEKEIVLRGVVWYLAPCVCFLRQLLQMFTC